MAKLIKLIDDAFLIWESKENLKGYPNVTNLTEESPPTKLNSSISHENAHVSENREKFEDFHSNSFLFLFIFETFNEKF